MFQIFNKKKFLIDYLDGFIDIHNHILPGVDDGAETVKDSLDLIKAFSEFGCYKFIATPHIMHNYYPNDPESIGCALQELKNELVRNNLKNVSIRAAAEHMIDSNFESILANGQIMPLAKNYLLVEMSYLQASINFEDAIQGIASHRLFPILAHPERYVFLHNRMRNYKGYKESGILFQLNFLSLTDYYGKEVQRASFKLLEEGLIDFIASDVHNNVQINQLKSARISKKTLDLIIPVINNTIANFL
ncbi:MAG: tyrosine-protein phosphatase [Aurantibacter sp.]